MSAALALAPAPPDPGPDPDVGRRRRRRQGRRVVLTLAVLGLALGLARLPPVRLHLGAANVSLGDAHEVLAYQLVAGGPPVRIAIPAGQALLRVLVNLDLPGAAPPPAPVALTPFVLRVRLPDEVREESFPLRADATPRPDGRPFAFYLGESTHPARTREVAVLRGASGLPAGEVEIDLDAPAGTSASVRLLVRTARSAVVRRLGQDQQTVAARRASQVGPLAWDELGPELRATLDESLWTRASARPGTPSRRLYVLGLGDTPRSRREADARAATAARQAARDAARLAQAVGPGVVVAYTVRGPTTLDLLAPAAPLQGSAELLDERGRRSTLTLTLAGGDARSLAIPAGLVTVRVLASHDTHVAAFVDDAAASDPFAADAPSNPPRQSRGFAVRPLANPVLAVTVLPAPAPPVSYDLAGRGDHELRLVARARLSRAEADAADPLPPATLRWRLLDARGQALASGNWPVPRLPAPEDRIAEAAPLAENATDEAPSLPTVDALPSEPQTGYLWLPPGAARLELVADAPLYATVASPGAPAPPPPAEPPPVELLHAPPPVTARAFYPLQPEQRLALGSAGRLIHLALTTRLAPPPPPAGLPPGSRAESVTPQARLPRFTLLAPARREPAAARTTTAPTWYPLPTANATLRIVPPRGVSAQARLPVRLRYRERGAAPTGRRTTGRALLISVDGAAAQRVPLYAARGETGLPPLPAGTHRLSVTVTPPGPLPEVLVDQEVVAASESFREASVYALRPGQPALFPLTKGTGPRALGLIVYFDGFPGRHVRLTARLPTAPSSVQRGVLAGARTLRERVVPVAATALGGASYLNRSAAAPVFATAPVFIPLHEDLRAGRHPIVVTVSGTRAPAFVRAFAYGAGAPQESITHFNRLAGEDE